MVKHVVGWFLLCWVLVGYGQDVKTYVPPQAHQYEPQLKGEILQFWNDMPDWAYFPSLIEVESCIHLKHKRCWNQRSQLLTKREEGAGFGQITKAFNPDGSIRFDSLQAMRNQYMAELKEASWSNIYDRADLQFRMIILMSRDNWKRFSMIKDDKQRQKFMDLSYNYGAAGAMKDRRICGLKVGCDPNVWDGNVELTCSKSKKPIYGNRSACDISRHHVEHVTEIRINKYRNYFK